MTVDILPPPPTSSAAGPGLRKGESAGLRMLAEARPGARIGCRWPQRKSARSRSRAALGLAPTIDLTT